MADRAPHVHVLFVAERSRIHTERGERDAWLALYGDETSYVEDPVGGGRHTGPQELARFFDGMVAPLRVRFDVHADVVSVEDSRVARRATIRFEFGGGRGANQPAHLVYDVDPSRDIVLGMQAFWEVRHLRAASSGLLGVVQDRISHAALVRGMIATYGLCFTARFVVANSWARFSPGARLARGMLKAMSRNDAVALAALFRDPSQAAVRWHGANETPTAFLADFASRGSVHVRAQESFSGGSQTTLWYERDGLAPTDRIQGFVLLRFAGTRRKHVQSVYVAENLVLGGGAGSVA